MLVIFVHKHKNRGAATSRIMRGFPLQTARPKPFSGPVKAKNPDPPGVWNTLLSPRRFLRARYPGSTRMIRAAGGVDFFDQDGHRLGRRVLGNPVRSEERRVGREGRGGGG